MVLLRLGQRAAGGPLARTNPSAMRSSVRWGGFPPHSFVAPPPPREYNPDGSPKKYALHQPVFRHGYTWETWCLLPAGCFHTYYHGDFAHDYPWHQAALQNLPLWVGVPFLIGGMMMMMIFIQNAGSIGIKPKRYTQEWLVATKERERVENTNPITRYLDRRRRERGSQLNTADLLPIHPFVFWMGNSHDWEEQDRRVALDGGLPMWGRLDECEGQIPVNFNNPRGYAPTKAL